MSSLWSQNDSSHLNHHPKITPSMSRQKTALVYLVITGTWIMTSLFNRSAMIYAQPSAQVSADSEAEQNFRELEGERARELFKERCVRCHGVRGDGRGVLASHLSPRPTDLTSSTWYKNTPKDTIRRVILGGGGALGKSIIMPANPDLRAQPKLVIALVDYIVKLVPRDDESKPK